MLYAYGPGAECSPLGLCYVFSYDENDDDELRIWNIEARLPGKDTDERILKCREQ